ncbi:MAG: hypothetical protein ACNA7M_16155, partial [Roseovarius sp.]
PDHVRLMTAFFPPESLPCRAAACLQTALYVDESATAKSFWADVVNDGCPGTLDPRNFVVQTKL